MPIVSAEPLVVYSEWSSHALHPHLNFVASVILSLPDHIAQLKHQQQTIYPHLNLDASVFLLLPPHHVAQVK
jgi:hypothetical protein